MSGLAQALSSLSRVFHTIKYLKNKQIIYRLFYWVHRPSQKKLIADSVSARRWVFEYPDHALAGQVSGDCACFLGVEVNISSASVWNDPSIAKLWLYNLHYLAFLNYPNAVLDSKQQEAIILRWIRENPPVKGVGWEPYPISLRLVSLVKWCSRNPSCDPKIIESIAIQADLLSRRVEFHILGNHLLANAKALIFAGAFLEGTYSDRYIEYGVEILDEELTEQFFSDGGHFELSPMYQCIVLWDLLDLLALERVFKHQKLSKTVQRLHSIIISGLDWLEIMTHPDGEISFFNDAAIGVAASPAAVKEYAKRLGLEVQEFRLPRLITLPSSGYSRVTFNDFNVILDHAAVGPSYLPGHGHADSLSMELSIGSCRVLTNSGTSLYGVCSERVRQRGTAAHNTVIVDQMDSSEVWSGFRVARRANAWLERVDCAPSHVNIKMSHDGYERLAGQVRHSRTVFVEERFVRVADKLNGRYTEATVRWHLHPDVKAVRTCSKELLLTLPSGCSVTVRSSSPLRLLPATWHPRFGESLETNVIVTPVYDNVAEIYFYLSQGTPF